VFAGRGQHALAHGVALAPVDGGADNPNGRTAHLAGDVLGFVDGPVVYDDYLRVVCAVFSKCEQGTESGRKTQFLVVAGTMTESEVICWSLYLR